MAQWPELDELKQVLNIGPTDAWDGDGYEDSTRLRAALDAGIDQVKHDIGEWDEYEDEPTVRQSRAALRAAELFARAPDAQFDHHVADPIYQRLMKGSHKRFAIS